MKRLASISVAAGFLLVCSSFTPMVFTEYHFAVGLAPNYGDVSTFAECAILKGRVVRIRKMSRKDFIARVSGKYPSQGNFKAVNLFAVNQVPNCFDSADTSRYVNGCPAVDMLWKLRYQTNVGNQPNGATTLDGQTGGWAGKERAPSDSQRAILTRYGIQSLHDLAIGDDMYRLLKDIQDPSWQSAYR